MIPVILKLSIITINYNNTKGLLKTIESVIQQTSKDFEFIIIDGGSFDGSVGVIKKYQHSITHWVSEPDNGIYHAMNKGIKLAKGEYCQFLNSGDCLLKEDVTEKMLKNIPDTSIIIGNMLKVLPRGKIITDRGLGNEKPTFLTFYKGTINHSPAYIRRNLFDKYGYYDESLKIVSDWKWYLNVVGINNEKIVYRNIDVALFDMNGISNSNINLLKLEREKVLIDKVPHTILEDYKFFANNEQIIKTFRKNSLVWFLVYGLYRIINKINQFYNAI